MELLKGKKVLIFQQRGWGINTGHFLAQRLQEEGCGLAAFTLKRSTDRFTRTQKNVQYDLIVNNDDIMGNPFPLIQDDTTSLEEICTELGIDSIWPFVATLRNHVRSYKDKYYYSYKQNVPDEEIIYYIRALYKNLKYIFDSQKPDLILSPNFVALPHIMCNLLARRRGVPMIAVTDCKVKGVYIFTHSYLDDSGPFCDRVDALNDHTATSPNRDRAVAYIQEFRKNFFQEDHFLKLQKKRTLYQTIRHQLSPLYHILKWYTQKPVNYLESTGITADYRPPRIILRDHYKHDAYIRATNNFPYHSFDTLKKIVYFPLQFQPEATIDVLAPYFNNQIETARLCAQSMIGDYTLVVKEHPAMVGYRSPSYLEKLSRTVNVKLIDYRIPSNKVIEKSDLIISPNSSSIAEAAFLGKAAIQLGNLGTTLKLPNVHKHTDMTTLAQKIRDILSTHPNPEATENRLINFVSAGYDAGFSFDFAGMWQEKRIDNNTILWNNLRKEIIRTFSHAKS